MGEENKKTHRDKSRPEDIKKLVKERDEYLAGWQRAKADLINFKRETQESLASFTDIAELGFIRKVLPVLDALEEGAKKKVGGAEEVCKLFSRILEQEGMHAIEPKEGDAFDPEVHEALDGRGTIVAQTLQRGYQYKEYIVRPAKVRVANG